MKKLKNLPGWKIRHIPEGELDNLDRVELVVIDLRDANSVSILDSTKKHPNILWVGVDELTNSLTLQTRQTHPKHFLQDVLGALQEAI